MQYPQYFIGNFIHACTGLFAFSFLDFCSMNRSIVTFIYSLNRINYAKSKKLRRFGSSTVDVKQTFVINYSSTLGFACKSIFPIMLHSSTYGGYRNLLLTFSQFAYNKNWRLTIQLAPQRRIYPPCWFRQPLCMYYGIKLVMLKCKHVPRV